MPTLKDYVLSINPTYVAFRLPCLLDRYINYWVIRTYILRRSLRCLLLLLLSDLSSPSSDQPVYPQYRSDDQPENENNSPDYLEFQEIIINHLDYVDHK